MRFCRLPAPDGSALPRRFPGCQHEHPWPGPGGRL